MDGVNQIIWLPLREKEMSEVSVQLFDVVTNVPDFFYNVPKKKIQLFFHEEKVNPFNHIFDFGWLNFYPNKVFPTILIILVALRSIPANKHQCFASTPI